MKKFRKNRSVSAKKIVERYGTDRSVRSDRQLNEESVADAEAGDMIRVKDPAEGEPEYGMVEEVDDGRVKVAFPDKDTVWFDFDEVVLHAKNPAKENLEIDEPEGETKEQDQSEGEEDTNSSPQLNTESRSPKKLN